MLDEFAERIGVATNNVAEYRAVLAGVERAAELGATELELINDSELVARQLTGAYKVKHPAMKPLLRTRPGPRSGRSATAGGSATSRAPRTRAPTRSSTRRSTACR